MNLILMFGRYLLFGLYVLFSRRVVYGCGEWCYAAIDDCCNHHEYNVVLME
jgi:hypothetical protein